MVLVLILALCSLAQRANASCATPSPELSPPSGPLPTNPTIYVFMPHGDELLADKLEIKDISYGTKLKFRLEQVGTNDAFDTFRIVVNTENMPPDFTVEIGDLAKGVYSIAPTATTNRAQVTGVTHVSNDWTCSHTNSIEIALEGNAVAYQLQWDDGSTTVVPPDQQVMWGGGGELEKSTLRHLIELGHLSCIGNDVDPALFDKPRAFELYALFTDGSKHRIGAATAQLGKHGVRLPIELVGAGSDSGTRTASTMFFTANDPWWWSLMLGAVGGITVLVLGTVVARKKSHVPRV
jgi:hypothetical protein